MHLIVDSIRQGDLWFFAVGFFGLAGVFAIVAQTVRARSQGRFHEIWIWAVPATTAAVAFAVTGLRMVDVAEVVEVAEGAKSSRLLAIGLVHAQAMSTFGALVNAVLCALVSVALVVAKEHEPKAGDSALHWSGMAVAVTVLGAGAATYLAVGIETVSSAMLIVGGVLLVGGLSCAVLIRGFPSDVDREQIDEAAAARWSAALGVVLSTSSSIWAAAGLPLLRTAQSVQHAAPEVRMEQLARGVATVQNTSAFGSYVSMAALVVGVVTVASVGKRAFGRGVLKRLGIVVVLWLPALGAFVYAASKLSLFGEAAL